MEKINRYYFSMDIAYFARGNKELIGKPKGKLKGILLLSVAQLLTFNYCKYTKKTKMWQQKSLTSSKGFRQTIKTQCGVAIEKVENMKNYYLPTSLWCNVQIKW